ncbi:MAG: hypothetical protein ACKOEM_04645 [Planctomycetia bacterium]
MAKAKTSAVEEIAAMMRQPKAAKRWYERVAPEHRATLTEIREAWRSGKLGDQKVPAVRHIVTYLHNAGIATIGRNGVTAWLDEPA